MPEKDRNRFPSTWARFWFFLSVIAILLGAAWLGRGKMDSKSVKKALETIGLRTEAPTAVFRTDAPTAVQLVAWPASTSPGIIDNIVSWGTQSGNYPSFQSVGLSTTYGIPFELDGLPRYAVVSVKDSDGFSSAYSNEIVFGSTPVPGTPSPRPRPTATATIAPTPPTSNVIVLTPPTIHFQVVSNGTNPPAQIVCVDTSNGADWSSFDQCPWFNAAPTSGKDLTCTTLTPSAMASQPVGDWFWDIRFSANGLPNTMFRVTLKVLTPGVTPPPTPRPTATFTPRPTATATATSTPTSTATATASATATATAIPSPSPSPNFTLSVLPVSRTVTAAGATINYVITVNRIGGFVSPVYLTSSGLPTGVESKFGGSTTSTSRTLTLTVGGFVPPNTYTFTVTGQSGSPALTRSVSPVLIKQ